MTGKYVLGLVALCALALASTQSAVAQSKYLDKGTSGVGVTAQFGMGERSDVGGVVAYSYKGILDIGSGMNRLGGADDGNLDVNAFQLSPFVAFHALKQSRTTPVGLALSVGYQNLSYSGDELDDLGWDMSGSGFSFGATVYRTFATKQRASIVPDFGIHVTTGSLKLEDGLGNTASLDADSVVFSFGSALAVPVQSIGVFSPRFGVDVDDDGNSNFGFSFGLTLITGS